MNDLLIEILANVKVIAINQAEILAKLNNTTSGAEHIKITDKINELVRQYKGEDKGK